MAKKTQGEVIQDLMFCKELLERLLATARRESYYYHPSVVVNDIIRLRRELNEIRKGME